MWWWFLLLAPVDPIDFTTETVAFCNEGFCEDKLVVRCNGEEYIAYNGNITCGDMHVSFPTVTGYAVIH